jgi:multiple sugar transport system ATP-binding protein
MMAPVRYDQATRIFPRAERAAVDGLTLEIADGEFLVLVGPSGCGKSTSLRMLAGLEEVDSGSVHIGERDVTNLPPKLRDVAMVFQNYALYPHMTVAENIGFALKLAHVPRSEIKSRVAEAAKMLDLEEYLGRKPKALSGGQRQRVAMGRAIVRQPQVFLLDEPLSNLDAKLRVQTRTQIASLQRRLGVTTVYVTHDQVEAMTMGTRVAVMQAGVIQQLGVPQHVYDAPANTFVARFIGTPPMNLFPPGTLEGGAVIVGVRPEDLELRDDGAVPATVTLVEALGHERHVSCALTDGTIVIVRVAAGEPVPAEGAAVRLDARPAARHRFDVTTGLRIDP